jgi:hypothetical protein
MAPSLVRANAAQKPWFAEYTQLILGQAASIRPASRQGVAEAADGWAFGVQLHDL